MNVILDVNVILDLLLKRKEYFIEQEDCFQALLERDIFLYFPVCALPTLAYVHLMELKRLKKAGAIDPEEDLKEVSRKQLSALFDEINICTNLAAHWKKIPDEHPDCEDALISLSASILSGDTVIWTEDKDFKPVGEMLAVGDHKTVQEAIAKCHQGTQFIDLAAQQRLIRPKLELGLYSVLRHGQYIMGPEVKELEQKLSAFVGVNHCISCSSGTDALLMALMALDIGPGDEIITVPYTWISTAEVIALLHAKPVFLDIQPDTFNMNPDLIEAAITPRTKAIMPVSIYGQCADMTRINTIAGKYNIPVIEDGAQSFGATHHGKKSCGLSSIGCTSFFPSKPLGCYGDGGAICGRSVFTARRSNTSIRSSGSTAVSTRSRPRFSSKNLSCSPKRSCCGRRLPVGTPRCCPPPTSNLKHYLRDLPPSTPNTPSWPKTGMPCPSPFRKRAFPASPTTRDLYTSRGPLRIWVTRRAISLCPNGWPPIASASPCPRT